MAGYTTVIISPAKKTIREICFTLLSLLPFFPVLIDPSRALVVRDLLRSFLPAKVLLWEALVRFHELPFWNPYVLAGTPFLADASYATWDPFNLIFLFFSKNKIIWAFSCFMALHQIPLYLGMHKALRTYGSPELYASCAALLFCWTALVLGLVHSYTVYTAILPLPFLLWSWQAWLHEKNYFYVWLSALFVGLPIFLGAPEFSFFYCIVAALSISGKDRREIYALAMLPAGAGLFSSIQLLPLLSLLQESRRAIQSVPLADTGFLSFHPLRLLEVFLPQCFGNYVPENNYWGNLFANGPFSMPLLASCGIGSSFLLCIVFFCAQLRRVQSRKARMQMRLASIACLFIALSFGAYLPLGLYSKIQAILLPLAWFRYPEKLFAVASIALYVSCASRFSVALRTLETTTLYQSKVTKLLLGLMAFFTLALLLPIPTTFKLCFFTAIICYGAVACLVWSKRNQWISRSAFYTLCFLLVACDIVWGARHYLWDQATTPLFNQAHLQKIMQNLSARDTELQAGAAFRMSSVLIDKNAEAEVQNAPAELDDVGKIAWSEIKLLFPSTPLLSGISDIANYTGVFPAWRSQWWMTIAKNKPQLSLDLLGVHYLAIREHDQVQFRINNSALPYLSLAQSPPLYTASFPAALASLLAPQYSTKNLVLENAEPVGQIQTASNLQIRTRTLNTIGIHLSGLQTGKALILLRNEAFHRNWQAKIHGTLTRLNLYRANAWAQAVIVPGNFITSDSLDLDLTYQDPLFLPGFAFSFFFFCIPVLLKLRRRNRNISPSGKF